MIRTPPQHQTDPAKKPGQIKTLGDYIREKQKSYMTSEEAFNCWLQSSSKDYDCDDAMTLIAFDAWRAAIEWHISQQQLLQNYHGT